MIVLDNTVELVPHVRLDPNTFRKGKKRSQHKIPRREQGQYWDESFSSAGITGVQPLEKNWWVTPIYHIHNDQILHELLKDIRLKILSSDDISANRLTALLDGGLSLFHDGKLIFAAQCCSDLTNISNWQSAAKHRGSDWIMLWNGHPWIYVQHKKGMAQFTGYTEQEPNNDCDAKFEVRADTLDQAVKQAANEIADFGERLLSYWRNHKHEI